MNEYIRRESSEDDWEQPAVDDEVGDSKDDTGAKYAAEVLASLEEPDSDEDVRLIIQQPSNSELHGVPSEVIREIKGEVKGEHEQLERYLKSLEVEGINTQSVAALHELTSGKPSNLITLYLQKIALDQDFYGSAYLQPFNASELVELGERKTPREFKQEQDLQTQEILKNLGFEGNIVNYWFSEINEGLHQELRLMGLLANQEFMKDLNSDIRQLAKNKGVDLPTTQSLMMQRVKIEIITHIDKRRSESYHTLTTSHKDALRKKIRSLQALDRLCNHIFNSEKITN